MFRVAKSTKLTKQINSVYDYVVPSGAFKRFGDTLSVFNIFLTVSCNKTGIYVNNKKIYVKRHI